MADSPHGGGIGRGRDVRAGRKRTLEPGESDMSNTMLKRARQAECLPTLICKLLILSGGAGSFASIPHTFPKAQAFCGAGDLVAGVSAFQTKSPAGGKDHQRHIAGFPLEKSK
jgi:hypothetical protein